MSSLTIPITYTKEQVEHFAGQELAQREFEFLMTCLRDDVERHLRSLVQTQFLPDMLHTQGVPEDLDTSSELGTLAHEGDADYTLVENRCWITVDPLSLYITKRKDGVYVKILERNNENGSPLDIAWAQFGEVPNENE
jgi:hypothetical protein